MRAILILSGGLDSTVSAHLASRSGVICFSLTFDYGQRSALREKEAVAKTAKNLGLDHKVIELPWLKEITNNALVGAVRELPLLRPSELDDREKTDASARAVWVPNRNGVFLNIAAAHAEALDCDTVVTGFNAEEAATFPDNSVSFVEAADRFFSFATLKKVRVKSFTQEMTKVEIVRAGGELGVNFSDLWNCYEGGEKQCGRCESCLRSIRAYREVGIWERVKANYAD